MTAEASTLAPSLIENIGGISSTGAVIVLLVWLIRQGSVDRRGYQAALKAAEERHAASEERHAAEMERMRERVDQLERRVHELTAALDAERRKRWHAEDAAADAMRAMGQGG